MGKFYSTDIVRSSEGIKNLHTHATQCTIQIPIILLGDLSMI